MKPFPPTIRERRRYILFKVVPNNSNKKAVIASITRGMINLMGEINMARASFSIVHYNTNNSTGIIRTNNKYLDDVLASLSLIDTIDGKKACIDIINISGTIKKVMK